MKYFSTLSACVASVVVTGAALISCNRDNFIEADVMKPQIILDSEYGVYEVKVGAELTISPEFRNLDGGSVSWNMDGVVVCREREWTAVWPEQGEFYVTVTAENNAGAASEDIRIDVLDLTPPVISVAVPSRGFAVRPDEDLLISPSYLHDDVGAFEVCWYVDGELCGTDRSFVFSRSGIGTYVIRVVATNGDGESSAEFEVEVTENGAVNVWFAPNMYGADSTDRYTFAGRPVYLRPETEGIDATQFSWTVDGEMTSCDTEIFCFIPEKAGSHDVTVTVNGSVSASVRVVCVEGDEASRMRKPTGISHAVFEKVYEWVPAPGQFINETSSIGGMTGSETTMETACVWAEDRMKSGRFVSLGAYGGHIVVGFDHSIAAGQAEYDFSIGGNAFLANDGGSNEPGVVWVMQDVNGNGLPDDEWYELKGCESGNSDVRKFYNVTYYRPSGPGMDVAWTDSDGKAGVVRYMGAFHSQDYYYPAWIVFPSYTLSGTLLPSKNAIDPLTGRWINKAYDWGYADNAGADNLPGAGAGGDGQRNGFRISNAVFADGSPAGLLYIDFIKVQTGVLAQSGILGEVSTEVSGFTDLGIK